MFKFIISFMLIVFLFCSCEGPAGPTGDQGEKGDQGFQGVQGEQGLEGDQGVQGIQGIKGENGIQGIQGVQGENAEVTVLTSILPKSTDGYWSFNTGLDLKYCIITVHVRENPNIAWFEPEWSYGSYTIWIQDIWLVAPNPGYEYLIKIAE